jgi:hypothetical protein
MNKFLRLAWRDKWIVLQILWMLLFVRIGLRFEGYRRLQSHIAGRFIPRKSEIHDAIHISNLVNAVGYRFGANCLQRSLVVWWMLRRHGIESNLHFGIPRQQSPKFVAHVWVQVGTTVINDKANIHDDYAELTQASAILEQESYNFS